MPERRADQSGAGLTDQPAVTAADETGFPFEVTERGGHRIVVCGDYGTGDLRRAECVEQADAFRGGERQVPAGQPTFRGSPQGITCRWTIAVQHRCQLLCMDPVDQLESSGPVT